MVMAVREEHCLKVPSSIIVTPSGMVMAVREKQSAKVQAPIAITPSGIVMATNNRFLSNHIGESWISYTFFGQKKRGHGQNQGGAKKKKTVVRVRAVEQG